MYVDPELGSPERKRNKVINCQTHTKVDTSP